MRINFNKIFSKETFARFASIVTFILALFEVANLILTILENPGNVSGALYDVITIIISIAFYLFISAYFRRSVSNFAYAFSAIFSLLLCDYILPFVFQIIFMGPFSILFILSSVTAVTSIVYFIMMILENKKRSEKYLLILKIFGVIFAKIFGVIFAASGLALGIYYIYDVIAIMLSNPALTTISYVSGIFLIINYVINVISVPLIFALYPFVLAKERYY